MLTIIAREAGAAAGDGSGIIPARARHVELLREAAMHLARAGEDDNAALEARAEELRLAGDAFGKIAGTVGVEEVLGAIFSEFCIGK